MARQLAQEALSKSWGRPFPTEAYFDKFLKDQYEPHSEAHNAPSTLARNLAHLSGIKEFALRQLRP